MGSTDGGQTFTNYFAYKSFDSNWLQIRSGSNSFDYEADSGENELEIEMKFNSSYVEVQECF